MRVQASEREMRVQELRVQEMRVQEMRVQEMRVQGFGPLACHQPPEVNDLPWFENGAIP